jgi:hypothetical protein
LGHKIEEVDANFSLKKALTGRYGVRELEERSERGNRQE